MQVIGFKFQIGHGLIKKYSFEIDHKLDSILSIDINPTRLIADTDESNNIFMSNNDE